MKMREGVAAEIVEFVYRQTGHHVIACGPDGVIIADSEGARIGTRHGGSLIILSSDVDGYAVTREEAARSGGTMKEGYNVAIKHEGEKIGTFGLGGDLAVVKPLANIASALAEKMLRDDEQKRLFSLLDELPVGVSLMGSDHSIRFTNQLFRQRFGVPGDKPCYEFFRGITRPCLICRPFRVFQNQMPQFHEWSMPDGRVFQFYNYPFIDMDGSTLVLQVDMDVTERKRADEALHRYQILSENARDMILFMRPDGRIVEVNKAAASTYQYTPEEILSLNIFDLCGHESVPVVNRQMKRLNSRGVLFEATHRRKDGSVFPVEMSLQSTIIGKESIFISVIRDITEHKRIESELHYIATHDPLTKVPNRYSLEETLLNFLKRSGNQRKGSLLLIDLDNFKMVNDTLGHSAGDAVLTALVKILKSRLRKKDFLARLGGDEFAVLLDGTSIEDAMAVAEKLRLAVDSNPICVNPSNSCFHLSISIGVVDIDPTVDAQRLLSYADSALYMAKERGRNAVFYLPSNNEESHKLSEENKMVGLIKKAIKDDAFVLVFQPIIRISDGVITRHEALIRMRSENEELISPGQFIPIAESYGLMSKIDRWVIKESLAKLKQYPDLNICINLSGMSLGDSDLLNDVETSIHSSNIEPSRVGFEITETAAVEDLSRAERWIGMLKALGCQFSLDDFGMGFSSFTYLRALPVDYVKIEGSFVRDAHTNPTNYAILEAINNIAHTLGKKTVAEFVENEDIVDVLRTIGIDYGQGYVFSRPTAVPEWK